MGDGGVALAAMEKLLIRGGVPLEGEIAISGAKNAALPIMCAALLTPEPLRLSNVPRLMDVRTMTGLLERMGVRARTAEPGVLELSAEHISDPRAPYSRVMEELASPGEH